MSGDEEKKLFAKVVYFDENLGKGRIRVLNSRREFTINYKLIEGEGFRLLFEGEGVTCDIKKGKLIKVTPLRP